MLSSKISKEFPHMNESNSGIFEEARATLQEGLAKGKEELKAASNKVQEINKEVQASLPTS
jgi:uncharacterized protein YydD (DUF2326 family)